MNFILRRGYYRQALGVGGLILILAIIAATTLGVATISLRQTVVIILSQLPIIQQWVAGEPIAPTAAIIVLKLRLPRVLLATLVGAGLGVAGATFQGIFRNPMAEPYVLGISSGAALGASVAMVFGSTATVYGFGLLTLCAFGGGILTVGLVYRVARIGKQVSVVTLLLSGIAISFFLNALMSLLMTFQRTQIERIVMWTMGSVATATWSEVAMLIPVVLLAGIVIYRRAPELNLILLGDESAQTLGVETETVKKTLLGVCTLLVSAIVAVSGVVGFIGLIIPHAVRLAFGADHRVVLPFSALGGALLLVVCDTLARLAAPPNELPLGVVTALFGVPFFLYLIAKNKKKVA